MLFGSVSECCFAQYRIDCLAESPSAAGCTVRMAMHAAAGIDDAVDAEIVDQQRHQSGMDARGRNRESPLYRTFLHQFLAECQRLRFFQCNTAVW